MKKILYPIAIGLLLLSCGNPEQKTDTADTPKTISVKEESITYSLDTLSMNGYIAWNENDSSRRPVVLVVHEWWGMNDYPKMRARQLAQLGYLAMAVDLYGNGKTVDDPQSAGKLAGPFYQNPQMAKARFDAALDRIKSHPMADTAQLAAIGYCFGGGMVLNIARLGSELDGVVSFHGSLLGVPADKSKLKSYILVLHGDADEFVKPEEVDRFKAQLDSIGAPYTFVAYPGATHAFSNPGADEKAKKYNMPIAYNPSADSASFREMQGFFEKIFK
ncbi:MAG: dienelactone hydrolase family protein [Bacteroidota bacterium]